MTCNRPTKAPCDLCATARVGFIAHGLRHYMGLLLVVVIYLIVNKELLVIITNMVITRYY